MLGHRGGGGEVAGNEATGQGGKNGQRGRAKDVDAQPNFFLRLRVLSKCVFIGRGNYEHYLHVICTICVT